METSSVWIPLITANNAGIWCFLWSAPWINDLVNNREPGDLRRHPVHSDVIVMKFAQLLNPSSTGRLYGLHQAGSNRSHRYECWCPSTCRYSAITRHRPSHRKMTYFFKKKGLWLPMTSINLLLSCLRHSNGSKNSLDNIMIDKHANMTATD